MFDKQALLKFHTTNYIMETVKTKPLSSPIFISLLALVFIRPFLSGLAYPSLDIYYQNFLILLGIAVLFINKKMAFKNPYDAPLLLILVACLISTITSVNIQNSVREITRFISYFSIFFLASQADDKQKKSLIKIIVISASIISLYSIYQYFWGYQWTLDYLKKMNSDLLSTSSYAKDILVAKRAIGTFPSPNILGGYLITVLFLSLSLMENNKRRVIWYLAPVLITIALILTKSLGAWLSLVSASLILFLLSYKSFKYKKLIIPLFTISAVSIIFFILFTRQERLLDLSNHQNSIVQRLNYWRTAIAIIKDHPILGVGPGNFQEVFLNYKTGVTTDTRYAHNIFLHQWTETGMLGFVSLLFLVTIFFKKNLFKSRYLFSASLAFILHNLIDITYFVPQSSLFWWIILGL